MTSQKETKGKPVSKAHLQKLKFLEVPIILLLRLSAKVYMHRSILTVLNIINTLV